MKKNKKPFSQPFEDRIIADPLDIFLGNGDDFLRPTSHVAKVAKKDPYAGLPPIPDISDEEHASSIMAKSLIDNEVAPLMASWQIMKEINGNTEPVSNEAMALHARFDNPTFTALNKDDAWELGQPLAKTLFTALTEDEDGQAFEQAASVIFAESHIGAFNEEDYLQFSQRLEKIFRVVTPDDLAIARKYSLQHLTQDEYKQMDRIRRAVGRRDLVENRDADFLDEHMGMVMDQLCPKNTMYIATLEVMKKIIYRESLSEEETARILPFFDAGLKSPPLTSHDIRRMEENPAIADLAGVVEEMGFMRFGSLMHAVKLLSGWEDSEKKHVQGAMEWLMQYVKLFYTHASPSLMAEAHGHTLRLLEESLAPLEEVAAHFPINKLELVQLPRPDIAAIEALEKEMLKPLPVKESKQGALYYLGKARANVARHCSVEMLKDVDIICEQLCEHPATYNSNIAGYRKYFGDALATLKEELATLKEELATNPNSHHVSMTHQKLILALRELQRGVERSMKLVTFNIDAIISEDKRGPYKDKTEYMNFIEQDVKKAGDGIFEQLQAKHKIVTQMIEQLSALPNRTRVASATDEEILYEDTKAPMDNLSKAGMIASQLLASVKTLVEIYRERQPFLEQYAKAEKSSGRQVS